MWAMMYSISFFLKGVLLYLKLNAFIVLTHNPLRLKWKMIILQNCTLCYCWRHTDVDTYPVLLQCTVWHWIIMQIRHHDVLKLCLRSSLDLFGPLWILIENPCSVTLVGLWPISTVLMNSTGIARYFPRCAEQVHVHHVTTESSNKLSEIQMQCKSTSTWRHSEEYRDFFFDVVFGWCGVRTNILTLTLQASQCKVPSGQ